MDRPLTFKTGSHASGFFFRQIKFYFCGLVCAAAFLFFAQALNAQNSPAMSFGAGQLSINIEVCVLRAENALMTEGFKVLNKQSTESLGFVSGVKSIHGVYILCNVGPDKQIWFNIVVASSSGEGSVPKAERVKLEGLMTLSPAADKPPAAIKITPELR